MPYHIHLNQIEKKQILSLVHNLLFRQIYRSRPSIRILPSGYGGPEIHESIQPLETESIIIKHFANSFLQTELESKLREKGITKIVVVGIMTHMCIDATVRAAVDLGYEATLIEDACATRELTYLDKVVPAQQVHYSFVSALNGMYANVISTDDFLKQN